MTSATPGRTPDDTPNDLSEVPLTARPISQFSRFSRRRLLTGGSGLALAGLFAACGLREDERTPGTIRVTEGGVLETPRPAPTTAPTATPHSTEEATPLSVSEPEVAFAFDEVGQGETALLAVKQPGARSASVHFLGRNYPLLRHRSAPGGAVGDTGTWDGAFWAVLGVGLLIGIGWKVAAVTTRDGRGKLLSQVETPFRVVPVKRPVDYLTTTAEVAAVLTVEASQTENFLRNFEQFNLFEAGPRWEGQLIVPVEGRITTEFGEGRSINGGPVSGMHSGTDIANDAGTPILAAAAGRVAWAGWMPIRVYSVLVDHGAGVVTGYHHLLAEHVRAGTMVEEGDPIALMGSTGFSTGPHLHWEMTIYGINVDPMTWTRAAFLPGRVTEQLAEDAPTETATPTAGAQG